MKNTAYTARRMPAHRNKAFSVDVVFRPALTPLEAAMIPAGEKKRTYGALALARRSFSFDEGEAYQRQKIWVR